MSKDTLNIAKHTNALIKQLGLNPPDVASLHITPNVLTATVYKRNDEGHKHMVTAGEVATEVRKFSVRT